MALDVRPLTLPELLDRSFSVYKRHVWLFAGIMAVPSACALVYALLIQFFQYRSQQMFRDEVFRQSPDAYLWMAVPALALAMLFLLVYFVAHLFAVGATTIAVARLYNDQPIDVRSAYRLVRPHGWRLAGLVLLVSLVMLLVGLGLGVVVFIAALLLGLVSPILAGFGAIVGVLFVMAGLAYFAVRFGVCVPATVIERMPPARAMGRSIQLTQGFRGRIFLILLCAVAVTYATVLLLQVPFSIGATLAGPGTLMSLTLNSVGVVLGTIGSMFTGPVMTIGLAMAYYDLRVRKEALDLQMMLESLDAPRA